LAINRKHTTTFVADVLFLHKKMFSDTDIYRYQLILKCLTTRPFISYAEIAAEIARKSRPSGEGSEAPPFSLRTLQRDLREIKAIYGMSIVYSKQQKGYFIAPDQAITAPTARMEEALYAFDAIEHADEGSVHIVHDTHVPQNTAFLYTIIYALNACEVLAFAYRKAGDDKHLEKAVEPYGIREFKKRLFLLALDLADRKWRFYALDRMTAPTATGMKFNKTEIGEAESYLAHCTGPTVPSKAEPEDVLLETYGNVAGQLKLHPLHTTQTIVKETSDVLHLKLHVIITKDLIGEIMRCGKGVKVIKPKALIKALKEELKTVLGMY
jgi:predicted DNA-binding transcriptional regulator YafY